MDARSPLVMLAHQGGWDEVLLVAGPLAIIGVLLWIANRRVHDQLEQQATGGDQDGQ